MISMLKINDKLLVKEDKEKFDYRINDIEHRIKRFEPSFLNYKPNFKLMRKKAEKYEKLENIVILGFGGSINNFKAMLYALNSKKNVYLVDTVETEFLFDVKNKCNRNKTLIVAISKSGDTLGVIENLLFFINFGYKNIVCITSGGLLKEIALKMGFDILEHPNISGRFSGLTECALFPALLCGIKIEKIFNGASKIYKNNKSILELAKKFFYLENRGYDEIFLSSYSQRLYGFSFLITQLIHETTGKNGLGQTIFYCTGPESQHESNQRFFGGRKNMVGFFIKINNHKSLKIKVSKKISNLKLKNKKIAVLNNFNMKDSVNLELEGVLKHAENKKIPFVVLELNKLDEEGVGELIAFWQLFAYYSAILRNQNPFDQPEVEFSKNKTIERVMGR
ncbi:MAG: hypothetical protein ACP5OZ_02925 [Candidatus Woesearchaeota archaeon]